MREEVISIGGRVPAVVDQFYKIPEPEPNQAFLFPPQREFLALLPDPFSIFEKLLNIDLGRLLWSCFSHVPLVFRPHILIVQEHHKFRITPELGCRLVQLEL